MLFDAHGDILTDLYLQSNKGNKGSFRKKHLQHYQNAGVTHSIFVNWTDPNTDNPSEFREIWDNAFGEMEAYTDIFKVCLNTKDMDESVKENKIGVILGMEGIMQLEGVQHLRELYNKGVRHAGLTWNEVNKYSAGLSSETEGLTKLGKEILSEMQKLGMIIDLAHSNPKSFDDILDFTEGPIIVSHGNTKALCNHIRNYTNEQLLSLKKRNVVIGICGIGAFIADKEENRTVAKMAEHIDYAVKRIGIDHVGIGLDICYYLREGATSNKVKGLETMSDAPNIFKELVNLGYTESEIEKIKYGNFYRVIQEVLG